MRAGARPKWRVTAVIIDRTTGSASLLCWKNGERTRQIHRHYVPKWRAPAFLTMRCAFCMACRALKARHWRAAVPHRRLQADDVLHISHDAQVFKCNMIEPDMLAVRRLHCCGAQTCVAQILLYKLNRPDSCAILLCIERKICCRGRVIPR
eukprot:IDg11695t1